MVVLNTISFTNWSWVPVQIKNFRIMRIYRTVGLGDNENGRSATYDTGTDSSSESLDYTRQDYPCNHDSYGDRMSFIHYGADHTQDPDIGPSDTRTWEFHNPGYPSDTENYLGPYACLFNFKYVYT